ncbi:MAG: hypothetical protein J6O40_04625 [Ruminococcus sp.]|nr:hypothetical protein [Ruminococcus sp.]
MAKGVWGATAKPPEKRREACLDFILSFERETIIKAHITSVKLRLCSSLRGSKPPAAASGAFPAHEVSKCPRTPSVCAR